MLKLHMLVGTHVDYTIVFSHPSSDIPLTFALQNLPIYDLKVEKGYWFMIPKLGMDESLGSSAYINTLRNSERQLEQAEKESKPPAVKLSTRIKLI